MSLRNVEKYRAKRSCPSNLVPREELSKVARKFLADVRSRSIDETEPVNHLREEYLPGLQRGGRNIAQTRSPFHHNPIRDPERTLEIKVGYPG